MTMDIRKVKKLIELLEESGISELEITEGEESVRISRHPTGGMQMGQMVHHMQAPAPAAAPAPTAAAPAAPVVEAAPQLSGHVVTSPMVGTFYRSPPPRARRPSPKLASQVKPGDTSSASSRP